MSEGIDVNERGAVRGPEHVTRPLRWSLRREIWENRSIYLAPAAVAALVLFASLMISLGLPGRLRAYEASQDPSKGHSLIQVFSMAPSPIMLATFIVGLFYALDALYGERRDRSILFWKSLPVSDATTVFAKALIPLAVLPVIALVLSIFAQVVVLIASSAWLMLNGLSPAALWRELHFFENLMIMPYGLAVHSLWFAPIYAWLLFLSGWAKRAPFLWAVIPVLIVAALERIMFNSWHFLSALQYRVGGAMSAAFDFRPGEGDIDRLAQLQPARFLSTPGLWVGLLVAAALLAATVRLRRTREPV